MGRNAVEAQAAGFEHGPDILGLAQPTLAVAQHVVARLGPAGTGGLGVVEKLLEGFGAVLGPFDRSVKCVGHGLPMNDLIGQVNEALN
jgi:hypothetical protein